MEDFSNEWRPVLEAKNGHKISESSIKTYLSRLYNLKQYAINNGWRSDFNSLVAKPAQAIKFVLKRAANLHSRATDFAALFAISELPVYLKRMQTLKNRLDKEYENQNYVPRGGEDHLPEQGNIKTKVDNLFTKFELLPSYETARNVFIASLASGFFNDIPPRRLEYATLVYNPPAQFKGNYLKKSPNGRSYQIVLSDYKTAKKHGVSKFKLPARLVPVVEAMNLSNGDMIVKNANGEEISKPSLSKLLTKLLGASVDTLRASYVTDMHQNTPSLTKMKGVAKRMGHSMESQMKYYVRR